MRYIASLLLALAANTHAGEPMKIEPAKPRFAEVVVISPGYRMLIDGKPVQVSGQQVCPKADGFRVWFLGGDPNGGTRCMVIEKRTTELKVQFAQGGELVSETWKVERPAPDKTVLRRPNGDYLQAVSPFF